MILITNTLVMTMITNTPVVAVITTTPVVTVMIISTTEVPPYSWSSSVCFTLVKSKSSPVPRLKISNTSRQVVSKCEVAS